MNAKNVKYHVVSVFNMLDSLARTGPLLVPFYSIFSAYLDNLLRLLPALSLCL